MEAVRGLQHVQILVQLIIFTDELVAEHTQGLLSQLLHLLVNGRSPLLLVLAQEGVHVFSLNVASAHLVVSEHDLSHGLLSDLHGIILVLFEFCEWVFFLGPVLYLLRRSCGHRWNVHSEDGSKVVELAFLGLTRLDAHWAHQ